MGLRKTSADSLATMHRLEDCAFFRNPFSNGNPGPKAGKAANGDDSKETEQHSRQSSVDPWSYAEPVKRKSTSLKGVQRGNSAAMDILRASPLEFGELQLSAFSYICPDKEMLLHAIAQTC